MIAFWLWAMLLTFTIDNQNRPGAIQADAIDKPWRPLPSNRIQPRQAIALLVLSYILAVCASFFLGTIPPCLTLLVLHFLTNSLVEDGRGTFARNYLTGAAFHCYSWGALRITLGAATSKTYYNSNAWIYLIVVNGSIMSLIYNLDRLAKPATTKPAGWSTALVNLGSTTGILCGHIWGFQSPFQASAACMVQKPKHWKYLALFIIDPLRVFLARRAWALDIITWKVWNRKMNDIVQSALSSALAKVLVYLKGFAILLTFNLKTIYLWQPFQPTWVFYHFI